MSRRTKIALTIAASCLPLAPLIIIGALFGIWQGVNSDQQYPCQTGDPGLVNVGETNGTAPATSTLDAIQTRNARAIIAVGKALGVPARGWVVAIATARQEAGLRNLASRANPGSLDYPHDAVADGDHDSVGLFQQRDGWAPLADRMDPAKAARMFFTGGRAGQRGLMDVPGWQDMPIAEAAQAVQVSAFPSAYAQWEDLALEAVTRLADGTDAATLTMSTDLAANCGVSYATGDVVYPVPKDSGYVDQHNYGNGGSRWAHGHTGTDLSVACGTPVLAATAGTIEIDTTQAWSGPWLVKVVTGPHSLATWYAHMQALNVTNGQTVTAGQQIGQVGSEGNSTGCHLHFEVHPTNGGIYEDGINPSPWLAENVGKNLGGTVPAADGTDTLRAATWTLPRGAAARTLTAEVRGLLSASNLDVLAVQQAREYVTTLDGGLPGYTVIYDGASAASRDTAIIARSNLTTTDADLIALGNRRATAVTINGLRTVSLQMPPTGPTTGTARAVTAYATATSSPLLLLGDWGTAATSDGTNAPAAIAERLRGKTATPGSGSDDYALYRGVTVTDPTPVPSTGTTGDHPITFTVR